MDGKYESVGLRYFFGGESTDSKLGATAQFANSEHVDFRKNPSSFTLLPGPAKGSTGSIVVDLVQDMTQIGSGERYAVGDAGEVYKITTANTWTSKGNVGENGGAGIIYRADVDMIYATGQNRVSRINKVTTDGTFTAAWFAEGVSAADTCTKTGGANTYTLTTGVNEGATHKRSFTSDIEPLSKLGVKVVAKGTGDWTLTLHDDANNSLGAVTKTNASLTNGAINYFTFSSPINIQRGDLGAGSALTYHFHLTSTVADGTVQTTTSSSLADCDMELWAYALKTTVNKHHPMMNFTNLTLIGNGRYVAAYEPLQDAPTTSDFNRHRLTLPPGYEVCGFAQKNLMVVVAAEKRSSSGEFQDGALFFWDGFAQTYNDWWPVPEGSPEGIFAHKNVVYFIAGGALYRMRGGDEPIKIRTFKNTDSEYSGTSDSTHVFPHMMTIRRGVLLVGYPSTTTNLSLKYGLRSLGAITNEYPESWGFSYSISPGTQYKDATNDLSIGMIKNFGDTLYISWRDDAESPAYAVDIVDNSSNPATTGTLESLKFDDDRSFSTKKAGYLAVTFTALPADTTLKAKYKIDGEASWNVSASAAEGDTILHVPIGGVGGRRYVDIEFGVDLTASGANTPEVDGIFLFTDLLKDEQIRGNAT